MLALCLALLAALALLLVMVCRKRRSQKTIGFFHPYCHAGGGGERVLWSAVLAISERFPDYDMLVYTGDKAEPEEILSRAEDRFAMRNLAKCNVRFVFLRCRGLVEAKHYPVFTLLGQSLGGLLLGLEALCRFVPEVFIDSMGYAFALPVARFVFGCKVTAYVHYPTISTDMLSVVSRGVSAHNNQGLIASSPVLTRLKLVYYHVFAFMYGLAGGSCHVVMVNSTWTRDHIAQIWNPNKLSIVYPPCDLDITGGWESNQSEALLRNDWTVNIVSLGQFRPEKDHSLQIRSFKVLLDKLSRNNENPTNEDPKSTDSGDAANPEPNSDFIGRLTVKLKLIGGCRNEEDHERVEALRRLVRDLELDPALVEFVLNAPFQRVKEELRAAMISIHTMWNEHFGICVVEGMAAGNIMIAHDSGGPKMDILASTDGSRVGFLASTPEEYANRMYDVISSSPEERKDIRRAAAVSARRFSVDSFQLGFLNALTEVMT